MFRNFFRKNWFWSQYPTLHIINLITYQSQFFFIFHLADILPTHHSLLWSLNLPSICSTLLLISNRLISTFSTLSFASFSWITKTPILVSNSTCLLSALQWRHVKLLTYLLGIKFLHLNPAVLKQFPPITDVAFDQVLLVSSFTPYLTKSFWHPNFWLPFLLFISISILNTGTPKKS